MGSDQLQCHQKHSSVEDKYGPRITYPLNIWDLTRDGSQEQDIRDQGIPAADIKCSGETEFLSPHILD